MYLEENAMMKRILLPLDGSDASEAVFTYGELLAERFGSDIFVFHACIPEYRLARKMHRLYTEKTAELMQRRMMDKCPKGKTPRVQAEFLSGEFTSSIRQFVKTHKISLVIMADHGFTSCRIKPIGSVADKIFRLLDCPTLLIRTCGSYQINDKDKVIERILLPLDGSKDSEKAISIVQDLAQKLKSEVILFMMVQKDAVQEKEATDYLKGIGNSLRKLGIDVRWRVAVGEDKAKEINGVGKEVSADLIVMATLGRSLVDTWAPKSVARKLLNNGDRPLLIV
jgi:nucleotide-binding universal stress UspA family protein